MLTSGIDSVYVTFTGELRLEVQEAFEDLKAHAQAKGEPQPADVFGGRKALVRPSGWGRYRYWLACDGFDVFVGSGATLPSAYVQLKSALIHEVGPGNALAEVQLFVNGPLLDDVGEIRCSRVDIYADFQGWVPRSSDYERFVVRSRKNTWHAAVHHDGRTFTGFTFGRDAIMARLYDKTAEIKHSGKGWMRDVWGDSFNPSRPVWRLEFQLRRQVLRECGLSDPERVITQWDQLWRYATEWLSLRDLRSGARRARWPVSIVWKKLAHSDIELKASPLIRQRIKKHDETVLLRGLAGYASSLAAISGVSDLDVTMALSRRRLAEYLDGSGREFRDLVHVKVDRNLSR